MKAAVLFIVVFAVISYPFSVALGGEFAPRDAYLDGSAHPYYGGLTKWNNVFLEKYKTKQPKRQGQHAMFNIIEGSYDEAEQYCRSLLETDPNCVEALFNLSLAQGLKGNDSGAADSMRKAVEGGLPFGRYLVGPRELIKPLREISQFKEYESKHGTQLLRGPMLGCLTDQSAKFWVRTLDEVGVQVLVSNAKDLAYPARSTVVSTSRKEDYTVVVEVKNLKPATLYYYDVLLNGKAVFGSEYPSFTTYPERGSNAAFEICFGGGAGYTPANERMWGTIASHKPAAFLFLGDNVYIDLPQQYGDFHRYTYYRRQSVPQFRRLVASASIYAIWDDHDCATNDAWMGPYRNKPSWKMSMLDGFKQNWNNPGYGDDEWPGCWFSFSIADVDFFMLDGRFYRTNPNVSGPTMLGPVQKQWLFEQVKQSKATFKVIASPVCWTFYAKGKSLDTWNGFQDERDEIFNFLKNNEIEGVILISADRHRSDVWRIERSGAYPLYEFSSSRLTNVHSHKLMPEALFGYNKKQSFGLLKFDTAQEDPTVTYRIVSIDNEVVHTLTVKRSELRH